MYTVKFSDILAYFCALDTFIEIRHAITWLDTESVWARTRSKRSAICSSKLRWHHYLRAVLSLCSTGKQYWTVCYLPRGNSS